jgi:hypothetical protein
MSKFVANFNAPSPISWDLSIQLDGITYPIREVTLRELNDLMRIMPEAEQIEIAKDLFAGNRPLDDFFANADQRQRVFHTLGAYVTVLGEKKAQAAREAIRAAIT